MKREGRQHGMVKTYPGLPAPLINPGPRPREPNGPSPTPTAGKFTKVPTKPTNHSKFTGKCVQDKCRGCHLNPASKSRAKVKGAQRLIRSPSHVVSDYNLITWRVVDAKHGSRLSGLSATRVLNYLDSEDCMDHYYEDDDEEHN